MAPPATDKEPRAAGEPKKNLARRLQALVPLALGLAALVLGTIPTFSCNTLKITQAPGVADLVVLAGPFYYQLLGGDDEWRIYGASNLVEYYGGYDKFGHYGTCVGYGALEGPYRNSLIWDFLDVVRFEVEVDGTTLAVRVFSILTPLLGFFLLVKTVSSATYPGSDDDHRYRWWERRCCDLLHRVPWKFLGYSLLATSVLQAGTLLILASSLCEDNPFIQYLGHLSRLPEALPAARSVTFPRTCEPAKGYYFQIAAVVLWALAGASTFLIDDPAAPAKKDAPPVVDPAAAYTARRQAILASIAGLREQIRRSVTDDQAAALRMALDTEIASLQGLNREQDASTGDPALDRILGNIAGLCEQIKKSVTDDQAAVLRMALDTEVANLERLHQEPDASTGDSAPDTETCEEP